jgi:hypothetical protein
MALFGGLAWFVMSFASKRPLLQIILLSLGSVLLVGVTQETIQMLSVGVFNIGASLFDLGIDLAGGSISLVIGMILQRTKKLLIELILLNYSIIDINL